MRAALNEIDRQIHVTQRHCWPASTAQRFSGVDPALPLFVAVLLADADIPGQTGDDYPFVLHVKTEADRIRLSLRVAAACVPAQVASMLETALNAIVTLLERGDDDALDAIDVLPVFEQRRIAEYGDARIAPIIVETCLHEGFEACASRLPGAIALTFDGRDVTYAALNEKANQLACLLRERGIEPDQLVGLCADRGIAMLVALLAILKSGGAYLPLDPDYPEDRIAYLLQDAAPVLVLADATGAAKLRGLHGASEVYEFEANHADWNALPAGNLIRQGLTPDHLAYVIYTSGSTGKPKGVMISHRNVMRLLMATQAWYQFNEQDVWTLFHSFSFDVSVWEIWGALLYGGRLVVPSYATTRSPRKYYQLLCEQGVTVLNQTPSAFRQLMAARAQVTSTHRLRLVIFAGEALDVGMLRDWYASHDAEQPLLVNMYGITETTVHVSYRPLHPDDIAHYGTISPIGRAIPDLSIRVLDAKGRVVPVGVFGELYIGGDGVARGYLNRPELTSERFVRDPFAPDGATRLYRSGDIGRWTANGEIELRGRNDRQVKLRGFRIELGEVEGAVRAIAMVRDVVAMVRDADGADPKLAVYVEAGTGFDASVLREGLKRSLPRHMLPNALIVLPAFPLTHHGKLDRAALPWPAPAADQPATPNTANTSLVEFFFGAPTCTNYA